MRSDNNSVKVETLQTVLIHIIIINHLTHFGAEFSVWD